MDWLGIGRRRLGTGMLVFGLAGLVMAGAIAVALLLGAFAARDLDDRLAADQARIAASLTRLTVTLDSLATTTTNAGTTLETSAAALGDARDALAGASTTTLTLASALDVDILGSRPFAKASESLASLARTITTFEGKAEILALNLHRNATDAGRITDQVRQVKSQVSELATGVAAFDRLGEIVSMVIGGIVLAGLLTAWVAVAAGACAWVGWRLRRSVTADPRTVDAAREAPDAG